MALMRTSDIHIGMELASDVVDEQGRLMIREGTNVSERELRLLKMWGVSELDVVCDDAEAADNSPLTMDPMLVTEHAPAACELFRHADLTHPVTAQLFRECIVRLARRNCQGERNAA